VCSAFVAAHSTKIFDFLLSFNGLFITTVTDVPGFFVFLGLAQVVVL
jgi:hypothetical protein